MSFSEWKTYKVEELCRRIISGGTPSTTKKEYYGGDIPWLKTQEVNFNRIYDTDTKITKEGFENSSAKMIEPNSIIVAMYGATAAKLAINKIPLSTNQACCNLTVDEKKTDYHFLYYYLRNEYSNLVNLTNGGAQQNLSSGVIKNFEIKAPDLKTQQRIASILSSLDDAIELNQQINKTLEEMSKAIFKEWFVDFNFPAPLPLGEAGVRAFQETEIGKIPVGWKSMKLNEALEIKYGKDHKHLQDGEFPVYGSGGIMRYAEKPLYESESILIPRKGTLSNLFYINKPFWTVDTMFYSKIKIKDSGKYLFHLLQTLNLASMNVGSAVPSLTTEVLNNIQIAMPDKKTLEEFEKIVSSLFNQAEQNIEENQSLINLRDTLLPKLMKGEIETNEHLPDVGKMMSK